MKTVYATIAVVWLMIGIGVGSLIRHSSACPVANPSPVPTPSPTSSIAVVQASVPETGSDHVFTELNWRLDFLDAQIAGVGAIIDCNSEILDTGQSRGPICRKACRVLAHQNKLLADRPANIVMTGQAAIPVHMDGCE